MKLSLLRAYLSTHKFDVICISETYLNSDTPTVDENLEIAGYTLIRADHPFNTKQVVFAFTTNTLLLLSY